MIRPIHFTTHLCSVLLAVQLSFQTKSFGWRCTIRQKTRPLTCHYSCHILKITSSLSDYSLTYKLISHILIVILLFVNFSICGAHMYTSVNVKGREPSVKFKFDLSYKPSIRTRVFEYGEKHGAK